MGETSLRMASHHAYYRTFLQWKVENKRCRDRERLPVQSWDASYRFPYLLTWPQLIVDDYGGQRLKKGKRNVHEEQKHDRKRPGIGDRECPGVGSHAASTSHAMGRKCVSIIVYLCPPILIAQCNLHSFSFPSSLSTSGSRHGAGAYVQQSPPTLLPPQSTFLLLFEM